MAIDIRYICLPINLRGGLLTLFPILLCLMGGDNVY